MKEAPVEAHNADLRASEPVPRETPADTLPTLEIVLGALQAHAVEVRWTHSEGLTKCRCGWRGRDHTHDPHRAEAVVAALSGEGWRP